MTAVTLLLAASAALASPTIVESGFVFETGPTPSCHASTIVETGRGILAAWFGGTREGDPDVAIFLAHLEGGHWSTPEKVLDGVQPDGRRFPCWNPVLCQPLEGPVLLFAKVGPSPERWWGVILESLDDGRTWSPPRRLPDGILGPIKNKPLTLTGGTLLCPSSTEDPETGWRVFIESTPDLGRTWTRSAPLNDGRSLGAIQPTFLTYPGDRIQALCRTRQGRIGESWSTDLGRTWSPIVLTERLNPNSGIDAVTLADRRHLLVSNPTAKGRTPLTVAMADDGKVWRDVLTLEDRPGEYSYPAVIQARDGRVHVTYTWNRSKIRHLVLGPGGRD